MNKISNTLQNYNLKIKYENDILDHFVIYTYLKMNLKWFIIN